MLLSEKTFSLCVRELQLRRETLAAMNLRRSIPDRGRPRHIRSNVAAQAASSLAGEPLAPRILSISDYDGLRISRELLLEQAGFRFESHTSSSCFDVLAVRRFQIAVLCHSIAPERAVRIAAMLHRYQPRICVVCLDSSERSGSSFFDRELDPFASPEELLRVLHEEANRIVSQ